MGETMTACPTCHAPVGDTELFCEACGAGLTPTVVAVEPHPTEGIAKDPALPVDLGGTASNCRVLRRQCLQ